MKHFQKSTPPFLLLLLLLFLLFSCSDYGLEDPPEAPLIETGSGVVGTLGGIVLVSDENSAAFNAALIIPEGALNEPITISIEPAPASVSVPDDPAATVVRFKPDGLVFNEPVIIGLSYAQRSSSDYNDYEIVYLPPSGAAEALESIDVDQEAKVLFAATNHFSDFALVKKGGSGGTFGAFTDARSGITYRTVQIGNQTWMADNLNYVNGMGGCYQSKDAYCDTYGYLYTWAGAKVACPSGWKLPSDDDWKTLELFLGVEEIYINHPGERGGAANVGGRLKDTRLWISPNEGANNETGFSAIPGGMRYDDGSWPDDKEAPSINVVYWTSTQSTDYPDEAYTRRLSASAHGIYRRDANKKVGYSVRCIKK